LESKKFSILCTFKESKSDLCIYPLRILTDSVRMRIRNDQDPTSKIISLAGRIRIHGFRPHEFWIKLCHLSIQYIYNNNLGHHCTMFKGLCLKIRIARKEYHKLLLTNNSNNRYGVVFDLYIFYSVLYSKCTDTIFRVPWDALFERFLYG